MARGLDTLAGDSREAWGQFDRALRSRGRSPRTIAGYLDAVAHFQSWLAAERDGLAVIDATRADAEEFLAWLLSKYTSGTAANRYRSLVQFWRFLAEEELADNIMAKVHGPAQNSAVPDVLTDAELAALLATCKPAKGKPSLDDLRDAAIIRIFLEPGSPRVAEMAALTVADIDTEHEVITIRHGKGDRLRVIPLGPDSAAAWFRYKRARRDSASAAAWLGAKRGTALTVSGIAQMLNRRGRAAGLGRVHPHQLRHTAFADFDKASGGHINAEMALFGWTSPQMAHHYGKAARAAQAIELARSMNRGGRLSA